jgi:hypothetical protein
MIFHILAIMQRTADDPAAVAPGGQQPRGWCTSYNCLQLPLPVSLCCLPSETAHLSSSLVLLRLRSWA